MSMKMLGPLWDARGNDHSREQCCPGMAPVSLVRIRQLLKPDMSP